jgi:hypothetical protein
MRLATRSVQSICGIALVVMNVSLATTAEVPTSPADSIMFARAALAEGRTLTGRDKVSYLQKAAAQQRAASSPPFRIPILILLAYALGSVGENDQAVEVTRGAIQQLSLYFGKNALVTANYRMRLAKDLLALMRLNDAEDQYQMAISTYRVSKVDPYALAFAVGELAGVERRLNKPGEAEAAREESWKIFGPRESRPHAERVGNGVEAPQPLFQPKPQMTEQAAKDSLFGSVTLNLVVSADGRPSDIHVILPIGDGS